MADLIARRARTIYEGQDDYVVAKFEKENGETFIAFGHDLPNSAVYILLHGEDVDKGRYGKQFSVTSWEPKPPNSKEEFIEFVSSLGCGFGKKRAGKLYDLFGKQVWDRLTEGTNLPDSAKKIAGDEALEKLVEKLKASAVERELSNLLRDYVKVDVRELRRNGVTAMSVITDPYVLCIYGSPFISVDDFALTNQYATPSSPRRIEAALHAALKNADLRGSSCLSGISLLRGDKRRGIEGALSLLNRNGQTVTEDEAHANLMMAVEKKHILLKSGFFYSKETYWEECFVAKRLCALSRAKREKTSAEDCDKAIADFQKSAGIVLSQEQRACCLDILNNSAMVLTGYPGTGKTTVIKAALAVIKQLQDVDDGEILLLSPTGRAARRMTEATGHAASTVLSALCWDGQNTKDILLAEEPCLSAYKYVIVDEMSMMDLQQTAMLLRHIKDGTTLVMIGDPEQLPSVGAGNVLHDIIASGEIPVIRLTKIYRQKSSQTQNLIPLNAARIREGRTDLIRGKNEESAFVLKQRRGDNEIFETARTLYENLVNDKRFNVDNVALLVPYRKESKYTSLTATKFNRVLQERINPIDPSIEMTMTAHKTIFRRNDKVIQLKNTKGPKNGDVGYIESITMKEVGENKSMEKVALINFNGETLVYTQKMMQDIDLAYASSVHKMQGSEADTVILVIANVHSPMLARNLIYTAITRATKHVIVVGEVEALEKAILRDNTADRCMARITLLSPRLHYEAKKAQK